MRTIHLDSCKLCKSTGINKKYTCRDHLVTGEEYPLMQCNNCGFIFTNDFPEEQDIGSYYKSENYISHSDRRSGVVDSLYHLARKIMLNRKYRIIHKHTGLGSGSLLDIGCGTGYFPKHMALKGWKATGIEKDDEARKYAGSVNSVEVYGSDKLEMLKPKSFDCITLWHVMEHFHDPDHIMNQAMEALKDKGLIVLALPNNKSYDAIHYGSAWAAWDVPRHLWHFNLVTISDYLGRFGLEIISISRLPFDAFWVSILSEKHKGNRFSLVKGLFYGGVSWVNSLANIEETSSLAYLVRKSGN